jgi:hypothetical protein
MTIGGCCFPCNTEGIEEWPVVIVKPSRGTFTGKLNHGIGSFLI